MKGKGINGVLDKEQKEFLKNVFSDKLLLGYLISVGVVMIGLLVWKII